MAKIAEAFIDLRVAGAGAAAATFGRVGAAMRGIGSTAGRGIAVVGRLGVMMAGVATGAAVAGPLRAAGAYEQLFVAFETMLGSGEKAKQLLGELEHFAIVTPFEPDEVNAAARQLLALRVEQEKIIPLLTTLGNIASGTNTPLSQLIMVYGQVIGKGRLFSEEMRQFGSAGVPLLAILAERAGVSTEAMDAMVSKGQIGVEQFGEALASMSGPAGVFFGLMDKQSRTTLGLWSTFVGNMKLSMRELGIVMIEGFNIKGTLVDAIGSTEEFVSSLKANKDSIVGVLRYVSDSFLLLKLSWQGGVLTLIEWTLDFGDNVGSVFGTIAENAIVLGKNIYEALATPLRAAFTLTQNIAENIGNVVVALAQSIAERSLDPLRNLDLKSPFEGFEGPRLHEFKGFELTKSDYSKGLGQAADEIRAEMGAILGAFGQDRGAGAQEGAKPGAEQAAANVAKEAARAAAADKLEPAKVGFTGLTEMWSQLQQSLVKEEDRKHKEAMGFAQRAEEARGKMVGAVERVGQQLAAGVVGVAAP